MRMKEVAVLLSLTLGDDSLWPWRHSVCQPQAGVQQSGGASHPCTCSRQSSSTYVNHHQKDGHRDTSRTFVFTSVPSPPRVNVCVSPRISSLFSPAVLSSLSSPSSPSSPSPFFSHRSPERHIHTFPAFPFVSLLSPPSVPFHCSSSSPSGLFMCRSQSTFRTLPSSFVVSGHSRGAEVPSCTSEHNSEGLSLWCVGRARLAILHH